MPRLIDQQSGDPLATLSHAEQQQLMTLLDSSGTDPDGPLLVDPDVLDRLEAAGLSPRVLDVLQAVLEDRPGFAIGWEAE
jgi:hypothetical protein